VVTRFRHISGFVFDREEDRLKRIQDEGWDRFACVPPCFPDRALRSVAFTVTCLMLSFVNALLHFDTAVCNACALALFVMCFLHRVLAVLAAHAGPLACTDTCCRLLCRPVTDTNKPPDLVPADHPSRKDAA